MNLSDPRNILPMSAAASRSEGSPPTKRPANGFDDEDEDDAPVPKALPDSDEPREEGAAQSLGRSISQVLTGGSHKNKVESTDKPKDR